MNQLLIFASTILVIVCVTISMYIFIVGSSRFHRNGLVGRLRRFLLDFPNLCCSSFCGLFFGCSRTRGREKYLRCVKYVIREKNPLVVIFYIFLVWPVEFLYLFFVIPELQASLWSKFISYALVLLSEWFYGLAVFSNPGIVTRLSEKEMQQDVFKKCISQKEQKLTAKRRRKSQPQERQRIQSNVVNSKTKTGYDFLLSPEEEARQNRKYAVDGIIYGCRTFTPSKKRSNSSHTEMAVEMECITCLIPRPSRSKHCRVCDHCVRRYDHHCPWINNDVAEGTHRWFLLFIFIHAVSCFWAAYDLYANMRQFLVLNGVWGWEMYHFNGRVQHLTLLNYVAMLVFYKTMVLCLFLFAVLIGVVLWVFWGYQMSFVLSNLTLNEMNKIEDAVNFISALPSVNAMYEESMKVRQCLESVAARPPKKLLQLLPPSPHIIPASKAEQKYRNNVRRCLLHDLKGMFDRGLWNNLMEVFLPYS